MPPRSALGWDTLHFGRSLGAAASVSGRQTSLWCAFFASLTLAPQRWMKEVNWTRGDASKLGEHKELLSQAAAVISCVGAFGSNECVSPENCADVSICMCAMC